MSRTEGILPVFAVVLLLLLLFVFQNSGNVSDLEEGRDTWRLMSLL
jgi:hypothetical protein